MLPVERQKFIWSLIGKPYRPLAEGPDAFDCYGLYGFCVRALYGVIVPPRRAPLSVIRRWYKITQPVDGALVNMDSALGRHVGIWLEKERGVLHALERQSVVFDPLSMLPFRGLNVRDYRMFDVR